MRKRERKRESKQVFEPNKMDMFQR